MLKLPAKVIQTKPSPQEQRYFLQRYTANVELYQETLKQYLQPPIEVTDATMAIEYLTKAIQAATKAAVPTKIIKPNYKCTNCPHGVMKSKAFSTPARKQMPRRKEHHALILILSEEKGVSAGIILEEHKGY